MSVGSICQGAGEDGLPGPRDRLERALDVWQAAYCPSCDTGFPAEVERCPRDGTALRCRSITFDPDHLENSSTTLSGVISTRDFLPRCPTCGEVFGPGDEVCPRDGATLQPDLALMPGRPNDGATVPRLLGNIWRLIERHSGGNFGFFWIGAHHILGMQVGVKVLRPYLTATAGGRRLFHQEAMRVSLLQHPNIVKIFDYGEEEGVPFLVMEYLRGKPLHACLREGSVDLDDGVEAICQVARALAAAHSGAAGGEPIVHLDIKPEHIFLERIDGSLHVKVIDFGIAEIATATGAAGDGSEPGSESGHRVAGTPPYMAPERFRGVVDPRSDIYSLGIVLYEVIAGRLPFDSKDVSVLRRLHEESIPTPPSAHQSGVATPSLRALDRIVLRALAKDAAGRQASAAEFLAELEAWKTLRAAEIENRRRRPVDRFLASARRVLVVLGAMAAVVLPVAWWGPWEQLSVDVAADVAALGPVPEEPQQEITGRVRGIGYGGATIQLEIAAGDLEPVALRLDGAVGAGGEVRARLPSRKALEEALGREVASGTYGCRLLVEGPFGRVLRSKALSIVLDYERPGLVSVEGGGGLRGDRLLLWEDAAIVVRADVALDAGRCSLCGVPGSPGDNDRAVEFTLKSVGDEVKLVLVSTSGNKQEFTWQTERFVLPRIENLKPILTREEHVTRSIPVSGSVERIEVSVGNMTREFRGREALIDVAFTRDIEEIPVHIRAWSPLSDAPGSKPDDEGTVLLERRVRNLEIQKVSEIEALAFEVRGDDKSLSAAAALIVDWKRAEVTHLATGTPLKASDGPDARIEFPTRLRGRFRVRLEARDAYGNECKFELEITHPAPPKIERFALDGKIGTEAAPIHPRDCKGCPKSESETARPRTLPFAIDINYSHPEDLRYELTFDPDNTRRPLALDREPGGISVSLDALLEAPWVAGRNTVEVRIWDPGDEKVLFAKKRTSIFFERPTVRIAPEDPELPPGSGLLPIRVAVSGASAREVVIAGKPARLDTSGDFVRDIEVPSASETTVDVRVTFEHGAEHSYKHTLWRRPIDGQVYTFALQTKHGKETIDLTYHEGFFGAVNFWSTTIDGLETDSPGATAEEVESARNALSRMLRIPDQLVELPTRQRLKVIIGQAGKDFTGPQHTEWIQPEEEERSREWEAFYIEVDANGNISRVLGDRKGNRHHFRLVIPATPETERIISPRNAIREAR